MRDDGGWLTCNGQGREKKVKENKDCIDPLSLHEKPEILQVFLRTEKKTPPECVRSERKCGIAVTQTVQMKWSFFEGGGEGLKKEWDEVKTIVLGTTRGK